MGKVILQGYIEVPDEALAAVCDELPRHAELTRQEKGCLVFEVSQDDSHPNRFSVYEEFVDEESFENHQDRITSSRWAKVTAEVTRHYNVTQAG